VSASLIFTDSLVAIVIVFTICWTPFHAQRLLFLYVSLYAEWTDHLRQVNQVLFLSAGKEQKRQFTQLMKPERQMRKDMYEETTKIKTHVSNPATHLSLLSSRNSTKILLSL
jgi:hypothetical protein